MYNTHFTIYEENVKIPSKKIELLNRFRKLSESYSDMKKNKQYFNMRVINNSENEILKVYLQ